MGMGSAMHLHFPHPVAFAFGLVAALFIPAPAAAIDVKDVRPSQPLAIQSSPLLSIDQNRSTVVERIVSYWGDVLAGSDAGLDKEQLRALLTGLRSDHLLATSLAGTLDGLRNAIALAQKATAPNAGGSIHTKALGDATTGLVYTPVVPCRIIDTRSAGGLFAAGGETRSYNVFLTGGTFAIQGGAASNCLIPANPSAVALNFATTGGGGFLTAWRLHLRRSSGDRHRRLLQGTGAAAGLRGNGDGTVTDNQTGLMWEKKLASGDPACTSAIQASRDLRCQQNTYIWCSPYPCIEPNGTLYTDFLAKLNLNATNNWPTFCFANHCDWRIPTIVELRSILLATSPIVRTLA